MLRTKRIDVRISDAELATLNYHCDVLNLDKSTYIRSLISIPVALVKTSTQELQEGQATRLLIYDRATFSGLHAQLSRWGHHYNQAVHALNIIASKNFMRPEDAERLMAKAITNLRDVEDMRDALVQEIGALQQTCMIGFR